MVEFVLPIRCEKNYGMNSLYAGKHWSKRKREAEYIKTVVWYAMKMSGVKRRLFERPVCIRLSYNDRMDCDNHGYMTKMVIDGMRGYLLEDDTRKYVTCVTQDFWDGEGVRVQLEEAEQ